MQQTIKTTPSTKDTAFKFSLRPTTSQLRSIYIFLSGSFNGGWISQYQDAFQFLQIDLGKVTKVTRIAHQGRADAGWWTKTFTLSYSNDGANFILYKNGEVHI